MKKQYLFVNSCIFVIFNTFFHILCKCNFKWHCMFFSVFTYISFSSLDANILDKLIELSFLNCVWGCTSWLHSTQCLHLWTQFITIALLLFAYYLHCVTRIHPFIHSFHWSMLVFWKGKFVFLRICFVKSLEKPK